MCLKVNCWESIKHDDYTGTSRLLRSWLHAWTSIVTTRSYKSCYNNTVRLREFLPGVYIPLKFIDIKVLGRDNSLLYAEWIRWSCVVVQFLPRDAMHKQGRNHWGGGQGGVRTPQLSWWPPQLSWRPPKLLRQRLCRGSTIKPVAY